MRSGHPGDRADDAGGRGDERDHLRRSSGRSFRTPVFPRHGRCSRRHPPEEDGVPRRRRNTLPGSADGLRRKAEHPALSPAARLQRDRVARRNKSGNSPRGGTGRHHAVQRPRRSEGQPGMHRGDPEDAGTEASVRDLPGPSADGSGPRRRHDQAEIRASGRQSAGQGSEYRKNLDYQPESRLCRGVRKPERDRNRNLCQRQ